MRVWVITDHHYGVFLAVCATYEEAMKMADFMEKSGDYPVNSLCVDEYTV